MNRLIRISQIGCRLLILFTICLLAIGCNSNENEVIENTQPIIVSKDAININSASSEELERLPNIGAKTSAKIIRHRTKFGKFRRVEHLLLVDGISEKRFKNIRRLVKIK